MTEYLIWTSGIYLVFHPTIGLVYTTERGIRTRLYRLLNTHSIHPVQTTYIISPTGYFQSRDLRGTYGFLGRTCDC